MLLIFVKNPELGKVKTRLAATLGNEKALSIYRELLQYTKKVTLSLSQQKKVLYSTFVDKNDFWQNAFYQKALQNQSTDLGEKMATAFHDAFQEGNSKVIIIGSDCLEITTEIIKEAFEKLNTSDVVIGKAKDGGYYLLGMTKFHASLFQNKEWSTSSVAAKTLADCKKLNLSVTHLPTLSDIDTEKDLPLSMINV